VIPAVEIPRRDPQHWNWDEDGKLKIPSGAPQIRRESSPSRENPAGGHRVVVRVHVIQKPVLTAGTDKINKFLL